MRSRITWEAELEAARPELVVTLGNAAVRVLAGITEPSGKELSKLRVEGYGSELTTRIAGRTVR